MKQEEKVEAPIKSRKSLVRKEKKLILRSSPTALFSAKIKVVGVGGGGGNAVSRMHDHMKIRGVEFIAINTDAQDLDHCPVRKKIYIGKNVTRGLGTGMNPELGRQAAEESRAEIAEALKGADLVFITAGFGGGTGSGATPLIADVAREIGALTIGVVTKPFSFEGVQRAKIAQDALLKLKEKVDAIIAVPNDKIFLIIKKETPILKAFEHIDGVLRNAVEGIAELIAAPGIVNVDFADVRAVMAGAGPALVGVGIAGGADRASVAMHQAVNSPLIDISLDGARGILLGISGGRDLRMVEVNEIAKAIAASADPSARIIFGAYQDRKLREGQLKVTLIATGFDGAYPPDEATQNLFAGHERTFDSLYDKEIKPASLPLGGAHEKEKDKKQDKKGAPSKNDTKTPTLPQIPEKKPSIPEVHDTWDIPTFLRRKKR